MVPIFGEARNAIGSVVFDLTVFTGLLPSTMSRGVAASAFGRKGAD